MQIRVGSSLVQQGHDVVGHVIEQGDFHKNQRLVGQTGVEKTVAAAVAVQPVFEICPTANIVDRFILDELFDQRGRRVPTDGA